MTVIWSKIVNYVTESINYLTYQSPIYVSITLYTSYTLFMPLVFSKYWVFLGFFSSPGTIKWISGSIVDWLLLHIQLAEQLVGCIFIIHFPPFSFSLLPGESMKFGVSQFHIQLQVWGEQSKANRCLPSLWTQSGHVTQGGPIRMNLIFTEWACDTRRPNQNESYFYFLERLGRDAFSSLWTRMRKYHAWELLEPTGDHQGSKP